MNGPEEDFVPPVRAAEEEPEKIKIWREEQQQMLKDKGMHLL